MKTKMKSFDCVEMKRKGAQAIRRKLQGLTRKQVLEYWGKRYEELTAPQRAKKEQSARKS